MRSSSTRRDFVQAISTGAAFGSLATTGRRAVAANERLNHACIGVGGMGANDLGQFLGHRGTQVVAICDVDRNHLAAAARRAKGARTYTDWRELLEKEGDRIDSINLAVPDHMHAPIALSAIRRGKHVYCQKPMCHDVAEVRTLTREAKKAGVTTQLGTQHASRFGNLATVQYLRHGVLGKIQRVVLCSNRPRAIQRYRLKGPRPRQGQAPPSHLNWDLWLGTAPQRDYAPRIYHPTTWRAWQDFGTGWLGDIGCHIFHAVWKGLGLTAPKRVAARVQESWQASPGRRADTWPQSDHITWVFPASRRTDGELTVEWYDGLFFPPDDVKSHAPFKPYPSEAAIVIGTEGSLLLPHGKSPLLLPGKRFKETPAPKVAPHNHYHQFADAARAGGETEAPFSISGPMTEAILLGTVAIHHPDETLQWDAAKMRIPNVPDAVKRLRRAYREGWKIDGLSA